MKTYTVSEDQIHEGITFEGGPKRQLRFYVPRQIGGDVRLTVDETVLSGRRLADRVSVIHEEIPNQEYVGYRAVVERDTPDEHSRALAFLKLGPECSYQFDFQKALVRRLGEDREETRALFVLSPGAEITINRPSSRYNEKTQFVITWDGATLNGKGRNSGLRYI